MKRLERISKPLPSVLGRDHAAFAPGSPRRYPVVALTFLSCFALCFALCFAFGPSAHAQEATTYTVRQGDTCGNIARHHYGHSRRYDLIHQANPELGAMPHHLETGSTLRLPAGPGRSNAEATVTAARQTVRHQRAREGQWGRSRVGTELNRGWHVSTGERSSAELTFRRSSVATMREQTLIIVYGGEARRVRQEGNRAVIRRGAMLSRLSSLSGGEPMEIETPSAIATLRSGESSVQVDESGETRVAVHNGTAATVTTTSGEGSVRIRAGRGTSVTPGRRPTPPRPLPRAPRWADGARRFVGLTGGGGTITGHWNAAPNAHRYRIEIARREDGRDLIMATQVEASIVRFEFHRLPPGMYYARVSTIDEARFEGRPGSPVVLTVVAAEVISPGATEPRAPAESDDPFGLDDLDNGLPDTDLVSETETLYAVAQYSTLRLPDGIRCRIGNADPVSRLRLTELGPITMTCAGENEPVGGLQFQVTPLVARLVDLNGAPLVSVLQGTSSEMRVMFEPALADASGIRLLTPTGYTVDGEADDDGTLRANVLAADGAATSAIFGIVTRDASQLPLAEVSISSTAIAREPEPHVPAGPEPTVPQPRPVQEAFGLTAFPSWVGLRDERRTGSGINLGVGVVSAGSTDGEARTRLSVGARLALFDDYLRIDVAVPLDLTGVTNRPNRSSRDMYLAASSRILNDRENGIGLAAEIGFWAPTAGVSGLDRGRISIAADFSIRLLEDERITIRTRQAGTFDLVSDGAAFWMSAYGLDVWIVGPFGLGAELDLVIGTAGGTGLASRDFFAGGAGLAAILAFDYVTIHLGARIGFGDNDLLGLVAGTLAVRGTYDLGTL